MTVIEPASHFFHSQRLRLHYVDWGNREAPTVILLHGGRDHCRSWDWVARALCDEWHVICPDLRGHGDSGWSPGGAYSKPFFVADLAQLLDHVSGGPVSLVGHSYGGAIGLLYAGIYPERVRRVAAIEGLPVGGAENGVVSSAEAWREWIRNSQDLAGGAPRFYTSLENASGHMRGANPRLSPEQALHLARHGLVREEAGHYRWKYDRLAAPRVPPGLSTDDAHAIWRAIKCPVWLVHGAESFAPHPGDDGHAGLFSQPRVTSYAEAGHWVHHDRLDAFTADLRAFLG